MTFANSSVRSSGSKCKNILTFLNFLFCGYGEGCIKELNKLPINHFNLARCIYVTRSLSMFSFSSEC